jgi:hypothetical protein
MTDPGSWEGGESDAQDMLELCKIITTEILEKHGVHGVSSGDYFVLKDIVSHGVGIRYRFSVDSVVLENLRRGFLLWLKDRSRW